MSINITPPGKLRDYLIGDLGVARRHLQRIQTGELDFESMPRVLRDQVLKEISRSVENCVSRIDRDIP